MRDLRRGATSLSEHRTSELLPLPRIADPRGNLTFIEGERHVPFRIQRAYWLYDVPGGELRGAHANRFADEFLVALSGSFDVAVDDGVTQRVVQLNRSYQGLLVPRLTWRWLQNFSTNAVCLVLASVPFREGDVVRDRQAFLAEVQSRLVSDGER